MNNIVLVNLESAYTSVYGIWQWDYGQILRIQSKKKLPKVVEVHFSLQEKGGGSVARIGTTADGVTDVTIPDSFLENNGATQDYKVYAFVYVENGESGNTEYKIEMSVKARPKPEVPGTPEEPELFKEAIKTVNKAADRAETAEQNAKDSASKAEEAAASAIASAKAAENTKTEALEEIGNKKQDALSAIQTQKEESLSAIRTQEENSVSKVTEHTNEEIQRFQNAANESKGALDRSIEEAGEKKTSLDSSIQTADSSKANLDESIQNAGSAKSGLDASTGKAKDAKNELDGSIQTAGEKQAALDTIVGKAEELDTSLAKNIESGTQLQKELVASGEKAVQYIQSAGTEQLDKMQTVADEFEADREQINVNKEDIEKAQTSIEELSDKKITKFYASNQGETHLADSDNGKIQDMMVYGKSERFTTTGKNLLKYPYAETTVTKNGITFTDNKDGSIKIAGTATTTVYFDFYKNKDGDRLTLASGTYKLIAKGGNKFKISLNNGVNATGNMGTITITDGHNEAWCYIEVPNNTTIDETIYPMIQLASIADETYEPYTGGIPSPNPDYSQEIKSVVNPVVKVCGKNLLQSNLSYRDKVKCKFKKGVTLTLVAKDGINSNGGNLLFETTDGNESWLGFDKGSKKSSAVLRKDVVNLTYLFSHETSENYALYIGDENTYEPYKEQSIQLPITLNAIPVTQGGNVTIDGQQYIADRVVEKDGVFGIERNIREIHTNTKTMNNSEKYPGWNKVEGITDVIYYNEISAGTSRILTFISNFTQSTLCQNNIESNKIVFLIQDNIGYSQSELIAKAIDVDMYIRLQDAIFEPLPGDIQAKLRTLVTNYPVTNISATSDQLDGYTVFNYPISMANGWNYVKQQLGDTREYIYDMDAKTQDMDLQSAEAYVNSEYAVALTELEVM